MNLPITSIVAKNYTEKNSASRFWTLDIVRVIAILAVLCFHVAPNPIPNLDASYSLISWTQYGGVFGVTVFFVLSGFSIHLSQLKKASKNNEAISWKHFYAQRLKRLYPAYLGAILLAIGINVGWGIFRTNDPLKYIPTAWDIASHLFLLHTLSPQTFLGIVPALWFIGVQTHIYFLYPIFWYLTQRWSIGRALLVVLFLTLTARYLAQTIILKFNPSSAWQLVLWMNAPQRWFEWCLGAWIAHQVTVQRRLYSQYILFSLIILPIWLILGQQYKLIYEPILGCLVGIVIWELAINHHQLKMLRIWQPIISMGLISYPVYLLHQIFIPYFHSALDQTQLNVVIQFSLILFLVLFTTLPLAIGFHKLLK